MPSAELTVHEVYMGRDYPSMVIDILCNGDRTKLQWPCGDYVAFATDKFADLLERITMTDFSKDGSIEVRSLDGEDFDIHLEGDQLVAGYADADTRWVFPWPELKDKFSRLHGNQQPEGDVTNA